MIRPSILVFAGSTRGGSFNAKLAALATKRLALRDVDVTQISLADYPLPLYDGDLEAASGVPEPARRLNALFIRHQGIFIASPEYNASIPALLKNAIDWISRVRPESDKAPSAFKGRVFALGGASPGPLGATRSLMQLRQVLELGLGATVIPEQVTVISAGSAFDAGGDLSNNPRSDKLLDATLKRLIDEAARYALPT